MSIAIIPARGGSQRIPRKNIRLFHGKPILAYSIETAQKSGLFDDVWVSTEDAEIGRIAIQCGARWQHRSTVGAEDGVGTQAVMAEALTDIGGIPELACCIYATAPLMTVEDLHRGLWLLKSHRGFQYAFSVGTNPLQDAGQFYWGWSQAFINGDDLHANAVMVPISSDRVCDINTEEDWLRAEQMYLALRGGV